MPQSSSYAYAGGSFTTQPPKHDKKRAEALKKPVIVTGGSGKLGRHVVKELNDHGYHVISLDTVPPPAHLPPSYHPQSFLQTDLTNFGQLLESFISTDDRYTFSPSELSIVHLAAIPAPGKCTDQKTFENNVISTYNVFEGCRKLGIRNVVSASSETLLGIPLDPIAPNSLPITEDSQPPRPESAYSLSKLVGETTADQYTRWDPEMKILSYRFSNVIAVEEYEHWNSSTFQDDIHARRWNAFAYIDARDGAQAVRKGLESSLKGHHVFYIVNTDSTFHIPAVDLAKEHFKGVDFKQELLKEVDPDEEFPGNESLLSNAKARKELGFKPEWTWRNGGKEKWVKK